MNSMLREQSALEKYLKEGEALVEKDQESVQDEVSLTG